MKQLRLIFIFLISATTTFSQELIQKNQDAAAYWATKGYQFDPNTMTSSEMSRKVMDIERAKYWEKRGYKFDPDTMTAWAMDQEVIKKTSPNKTSTIQISGTSSDQQLEATENGDIRGTDNSGSGREKTVHVSGYYRKDGTYVKEHYRAKPRK